MNLVASLAVSIEAAGGLGQLGHQIFALHLLQQLLHVTVRLAMLAAFTPCSLTPSQTVRLELQFEAVGPGVPSGMGAAGGNQGHHRITAQQRGFLHLRHQGLRQLQARVVDLHNRHHRR